jgi:hypothetical protein
VPNREILKPGKDDNSKYAQYVSSVMIKVPKLDLGSLRSNRQDPVKIGIPSKSNQEDDFEPVHKKKSCSESKSLRVEIKQSKSNVELDQQHAQDYSIKFSSRPSSSSGSLESNVSPSIGVPHVGSHSKSKASNTKFVDTSQ